MAGGAGVPTIQARLTLTAMTTLQYIMTTGIAVIGTALLWLSGYATGFDNGLEEGNGKSFEKVAKEAVQTGKEMLEIAKKLQKEKDDLQKENDRLKEQLSQEQNQKQ